VAVDLAAEAAKQKEIMKALRASQMDKPPPVAMKKNPITGKMEKFESAALQDDLPDEEVRTSHAHARARARVYVCVYVRALLLPRMLPHVPGCLVFVAG
jgi:hypothetical protein